MNEDKKLLAEEINARVKELESHLVAIRRDIHAHPELGFDTVRTANLVTQQLLALGLQPKTGVGRTGVMVDIHGAEPGKVVLLRADMDALPIQEQTGCRSAAPIPEKCTPVVTIFIPRRCSA